MASASPASQSPLRDLSIPKSFKVLKDPRRRQRRLHLLQDIIVSALCAILAGAQDWQEIETVGRQRHDWLKRFLKLPNGIPSHDTLERVFDRLNPPAFPACFREWVRAVQEALAIKHGAIDGKTFGGSGSAQRGPLHLVSAWATAQRWSLGQVAGAEKSNEITAIPVLLDLLDSHDALVTIDALGCPKALAETIIDHGGNYLVTVTEHQPHRLEDIPESLARALDTGCSGLEHDTSETRERGHGREAQRCDTVLHHTAGLRDADAWAGLTTIGMCQRQRTVHGVSGEAVRYFIGSKKARAQVQGKALRNHWGIANALHWQRDVTFDEDHSRVSKRNAAENLALLRRLTLSRLQAHPAKLSIAKKRLAAALDPAFLEEILRGDGILEKR